MKEPDSLIVWVGGGGCVCTLSMPARCGTEETSRTNILCVGGVVVVAGGDGSLYKRTPIGICAKMQKCLNRSKKLFFRKLSIACF